MIIGASLTVESKSCDSKLSMRRSLPKTSLPSCQVRELVLTDVYRSAPALTVWAKEDLGQMISTGDVSYTRDGKPTNELWKREPVHLCSPRGTMD